MKDDADRFTLEIPGLDTPKRGRPRKPDALTPAQRAKRYRARKSTAARKAKRQEKCRYAGPNGEYWSGRGKKPRWVECMLDRGLTLAMMDTWSAPSR